LRFGFHLAVSPASVEAQILGEHGTSEVFVWSSAHVAGTPIRQRLAQSLQNPDKFRRDIEQEVRFANISIIEGIGASQHGIGMVSARIAEMVLRDERAVIPIGSYSLNTASRGHCRVFSARRARFRHSSRKCRTTSGLSCNGAPLR
jgi:L-lactate dehydrogenase